MMAIFEIINATDSLIKAWFASVEAKMLETMLNYTHHFIKIRLVFHTPNL